MITLLLATLLAAPSPAQSPENQSAQAQFALEELGADAQARVDASRPTTGEQARALTSDEYRAVRAKLSSLVPPRKDATRIEGRLDGSQEKCAVTIELENDGSLTLTSDLFDSYLSGFNLHPGKGSGFLPDLYLSAAVDGDQIEVLKPLYQSNSRTRLVVSQGRLKTYALSYPSKQPLPGYKTPEIVCRF